MVFERSSSDGKNGHLRVPFDGSVTPREVWMFPPGTISCSPVEVAPGGGSYLAIRHTGDGDELWIVPLGDTELKPRLAVETVDKIGWAGHSPDGKWIAYLASDQNLAEALVRRLNPTTFELGPVIRVPLSGDRPRSVNWFKEPNAKGQPELCVAYNWDRYSAIAMTVEDPQPQFGPEQRVFDIRSMRAITDELLPGKRLIFVVPGPGEKPSSELRLMTNFVDEIRARLER